MHIYLPVCADTWTPKRFDFAGKYLKSSKKLTANPRRYRLHGRHDEPAQHRLNRQQLGTGEFLAPPASLYLPAMLASSEQDPRMEFTLILIGKTWFVRRYVACRLPRWLQVWVFGSVFIIFQKKKHDADQTLQICLVLANIMLSFDVFISNCYIFVNHVKYEVCMQYYVNDKKLNQFRVWRFWRIIVHYSSIIFFFC